MTSALLDAFDRQAAWCRAPSPFTARVLERSRLWLGRDGAANAAFAAVADDPLAAAIALRWAAALHHLALRGLAPWATVWPPADAPSDAELDAAIAVAWGTQRAHCAAALALPPQTNEVQRSAALLPGLLHVAARTGRPLALVEIGASAGLNLWCDRYRHDHGSWAWGDPAAALTLRSLWHGAPPPMPDLQVVRRVGCDAHPIDLAQPDEGLRLASFIWPDQGERLDRLNSARAAVARWMALDGVAVERLAAPELVARELAAPVPAAATVLMHSVVWQYMAEADRQAVAATVDAAARRATAAAPLAWLRFEPPRPDVQMELRCRVWPGGEDTLLALCHPHGARVDWVGGLAGAAA